MFPQFGATAESLSKASSLVLRIGTDAHLYDDPDDANIPTLLDSRYDSEKAEALKRLLALIAQGADVSHLFPQVVKNVASQSLEVKKLVYLFLLHYAEKRPNEALLSINCFQKDLSDTNPLVRAWALRTMAGIRLHVVAPLILAAVTKCSRDPSAYVRKCAAYALPKLHELNQEEHTALEELVDILLSDHSPGVVGAAAAAYNSVCRNNFPLIAKHFRRLCETLPDIEEWPQVVLIEILLRYAIAKHGLVRGSIMFGPVSTLNSRLDVYSADVKGVCDGDHGVVGGEVCDFMLNATMFRFYIEGQESLSPPISMNGDGNKSDCSALTTNLNDDVKILLQCTSPLLWSQNSAVVHAAAGVHWIMAPIEELKRIVSPILFILRSSPATKYVMLSNILVFAKTVPSLFAPFFEEFFICSSDSYQIRRLKLEILSTIATESSIPIIFEEFQDYIKDPDRRFVADTVAAVGSCAQRLPIVATSSIEGLVELAAHESSIYNSFHFDEEDSVLVQAIMSIKAILKQDPASHEKVIVRMVRSLDKIKVPEARSLIIWILGEYSSLGKLIPKIAPCVLRYLAWSFTSEESESKLQILNTSVKVVLHIQGDDSMTLKKIMQYIIELARCDPNYDVRDRARFLSKLMASSIIFARTEESVPCPQNGNVDMDVVEHILIGKLPPLSHSDDFRIYLPGSLSQVVLHAAPGYAPLPEPCSMPLAYRTNESSEKTGMGNDFEVNDSNISSGSLMEVSGSSYDSEHFNSGSADSEATGFASDQNGNGRMIIAEDDRAGPLVDLSDASIDHGQTSQNTMENISSYISTDLTEMLSKSALESWLDEQPTSSAVQGSELSSSARISFTDHSFERKAKFHMMLDPANSDGLHLQYAFSCEASTVSPLLVCVELFFENVTSEPMRNIAVIYEESSGSVDTVDRVFEETPSILSSNDIPTILPVEEIPVLAPRQITKKLLQVHFHHHLLPLKLIVFCNGKRHLTKLWPDIAYFVRPLSIDMKAFSDKEHQLLGMFEYSRRCTFKDHLQELEHKESSFQSTDKNLLVAKSFASKILNNANLHLVSMEMPVSFKNDDASGLCLRFSGEILSSSKPCLITIVTLGKISGPLDVTVKVNSEDTTFGLNLLNRVVTILQ